MRVLCIPHEEFVFSLLGSRFFRVYLSRSPLSYSSTSSVAMTRDEQLAAMLTACLSHISICIFVRGRLRPLLSSCGHYHGGMRLASLQLLDTLLQRLKNVGSNEF